MRLVKIDASRPVPDAAGVRASGSAWPARWLVVAVLGFAGGDAQRTEQVTVAPATESLPSPASIWLTSDDLALALPVAVELTSPTDPGFHRVHTFAAGEVLLATFPLSSGHYRLTALAGRCVGNI